MLLYIHIPFCDSKCHYCAFNSYTYLHHLKENYIIALKKQLQHNLTQLKPQIETVFIGGGTPSTIPAKYYQEIFDTIQPYLKQNCEITIEANPNSASLKWQKEIYDIGINRISFGVQSFDDDKLKFLGRNHTKDIAIKAIENASNAGFTNINCDIIYDTVKDTKQLLTKDLQYIETLPINHISAYSLTIEENTHFATISTHTQKEDETLTKFLFDRLEVLGFSQYEISNFANNTQARSIHNLGYWEYKEYLGCGAGAVGTIKNHRYYTTKDVMNYINNPLEYDEVELLTDEDIQIEKLLLGFRSIVGVEKDIFTSPQLKNVEILLTQNKLIEKDDKIYNPNFLLADELVLFIDDNE